MAEELLTAPKLRDSTRKRINDLKGKYGYRTVSDVTDMLMKIEEILTENRRLLTPAELLEFTRKLVTEHEEKRKEQ